MNALLQMGFIRPFRQLYRFRRMLAATTNSELRSQYAGSVLGLAWVFLGPAILLVLYATVYGVIFRAKPANMTTTGYLLYVMAGLVGFMAFSSSLTAGAASIMRNKQALLSTVYPPELVTVRAVLVQSAPLVSGLLLTAAVSILSGSAHASMALVPLVAVAQVVFTCGLCLLLALVTLALRDIQQILQYVSFVLLIVTPIGYDRAMVPTLLQWAMLLNPLYYFVTCYQDMIVAGTVPWTLFATTTIGSVLVFSTAAFVFQRAKQVFFEYA